MNEDMIRKLVRFKLSALHAMIDSMPEDLAEEIRGLGKVVLESVNEFEAEAELERKSGGKDELNSVTIE